MDLPPLQVSTLGRFVVFVDGREVTFRRAKSKQLFAWLLLEFPRKLHEEIIMDHFWRDSTAEKSRQNLQKTVSSLRKSLERACPVSPRSYVELDSNLYSIHVPAASRVDFLTFERSYDSLRSGGNGEFDFSKARDREIRSALDLCGGSLLPEMRFEEFAVGRREELNHKYFHLLENYVSELLRKESLEVAETYIVSGLRTDPLWEDGVRLAMELYSRTQRTLHAMRAYRNYEARLKAELDIEPGLDLQEMFERIRS
jgi:DNA-binding SARP family transcriptional activator